MAAPRLMTVDDYLRTPETLTPVELIYGVMRVAESPLARHQALVAELFVALRSHVRERGLGTVWVAPLDVILDEKRALVLQPDLFFIAAARQYIVDDRVHGAPDLVIEILSPEPRIGKTDERLRWFAEYGVCECWLVHQEDLRVEVIAFGDGRITSRVVFRETEPMVSGVLPEFHVRMADIG